MKIFFEPFSFGGAQLRDGGERKLQGGDNLCLESFIRIRFLCGMIKELFHPLFIKRSQAKSTPHRACRRTSSHLLLRGEILISSAN